VAAVADIQSSVNVLGRVVYILNPNYSSEENVLRGIGRVWWDDYKLVRLG
jgi:hypothetical protein